MIPKWRFFQLIYIVIYLCVLFLRSFNKRVLFVILSIFVASQGFLQHFGIQEFCLFCFYSQANSFVVHRFKNDFKHYIWRYWTGKKRSTIWDPRLFKVLWYVSLSTTHSSTNKGRSYVLFIQSSIILEDKMTITSRVN